eukprot:sb/3477513/
MVTMVTMVIMLVVVVLGYMECYNRSSLAMLTAMSLNAREFPGERREDDFSILEFFNQGTGGGVFLTLFQTRISLVPDEVETYLELDMILLTSNFQVFILSGTGDMRV